jgi:3-oxoacyl-[acyl-carrier protein] reductase
MKLADRVTIVTGGALGIGKAIATACAREGARIVLCDIAAPALAAAEAEIRALGASVLCLRANVTDGAQVAAMVEEVVKTWGRVDILVNNAGGGIGPKGLTETRDEEWDAVVNLNLRGQFLCCREVAAPMRRQAWGRIINIGSNAGRYRSNTGFGDLAYSAAKGGVLQLTRSVAHELGAPGSP